LIIESLPLYSTATYASLVSSGMLLA